MKILHTSDWHIGKRLRGHSMAEDHDLFFEWLIETINTQSIEVLIVAGDIFDVAHPSNEAMQQYYKVLLEITKTCCKEIVIVGGNHDSAHTLNAPKDILKFLNVHIVGGATEDIEKEIIRLNINNEPLTICAVPFLRDKDVKKANIGETYEDRIEAVKNGIFNHYNKLAELVKEDKDTGIPIIATGHLYVQNANLSDSERDIQVGNLAGVEGNAFSNIFDYVALGHVHIPQSLDEEKKVRYSGSPLALSFKEREERKIVIVLDTSKDQLHDIEKIAIPNFRQLIRIEGDFRKVQDKIIQYKQKGALKTWAEIIVKEEFYDPTLGDQLAKFLETVQHLEILKYSLQFENKVEGADELFGNSTITDLDPKEVFTKRLEGDKIENTEELNNTFSELIEWMHNAEIE